MTEDELAQIREVLREELAALRHDVATMGAQVAGIPLIHRDVEDLILETRQIAQRPSENQ